MNEEQYISRISQLENEIEYLHGLLENAGISYKREAKELEDLSPNKNLAFEENQGARILPVTITKQHVRYYYHLFKGRNDVFSKRSGKANKKTRKHGYYTQCWNFWKDGVCPKKNKAQFSCGECQNQRYKELTGQVLYEHLLGAREDASDVIGLYPMFPDETINFLVFDFDCHDDKIGGDDGANLDSEWMTEVNAFRKICEINEVPILVERSRSGMGAHIWMFFENPILAITARRFGTALLTKGAESVNMRSFKYYDRMLPAQDHIPINTKTGKTGLGNLVALPLQGQALKCGNSAFIDENWNAYPNQWECLKEVKKLSNETVEEKIKEWSAEGILGILNNEFAADTDAPNDMKPWEKDKHPLHKEDISSVVEIVIADKVYVNTKNMKPRMQNALRRMAAFSNPDFYKKAAMGLSTKGIPRIVFCGYDEGVYICIPRALLDSIVDRFNEADIPFFLTDNRCDGTPLDVLFNGTLYEEQMRGAKAILEHDNGVLAATTSFGKTVVGAYMIAQRKTNTLILVHNTEIQKNWIEDLDKFLNINAELPEYQTKTGRTKKRKSVIGKLYAGHNSMTGIIDVAIFSSLGKGNEINPIIEQYGMVIMDECHHGAAQTVEDVIGSAKAKYVYGLTATPKREDGLEKKVFMQFGPIRFRYTAKERAEKQGIFDIDTYENIYERDLLEANKEIIISSPGLNRTKVNAFIRLVRRRQEDGVKVTVVTLNPERYPEEKTEDTKILYRH